MLYHPVTRPQGVNNLLSLGYFTDLGTSQDWQCLDDTDLTASQVILWPHSLQLNTALLFRGSQLTWNRKWKCQTENWNNITPRNPRLTLSSYVFSRGMCYYLYCIFVCISSPGWLAGWVCHTSTAHAQHRSILIIQVSVCWGWVTELRQFSFRTLIQI